MTMICPSHFPPGSMAIKLWPTQVNVKDVNVAIFQLKLTFALPAGTNSYGLLGEAKKKKLKKVTTFGDFETASSGTFNSNSPILSKLVKVP